MLIDTNWRRAVESPDDGDDIFSAEDDLELEKFAAAITPERKQHELDLWKQWKAQPLPETFAPLYRSHQNLIQKTMGRQFKSTTLPEAAVKSHVLRGYIKAIQNYDPTRSALTTYVINGLRESRTGRYFQKYQNAARIIEERAGLIDLMKNREADLQEQLGRLPSADELADDMMIAISDVNELKKKKITARTVATLRKERRDDFIAEQAGGDVSSATGGLLDHITFLHGSLPPEHKLVLEHTFEGWGRPVITDPMKLSKVINLSPQKIRSIKKQIAEQVEQHFGQETRDD